jgi:TRAP-type transport system periplasmic protein
MERKALLAALMVSLAGAPSWAQNVVTLKMANWVPPTHHVYESFQRLAERTAQLSNGTLKIEVDSTAVANPGGQYDLIKNRVRDMAWDVASYNPGLFELSRAIEQPFLVRDAGLAARALQKWYLKHGFDKREWPAEKGVVLLHFFVGGGGHLFTAKTQVKLPEDAKGLKIRAAGPNEAAAKLIGAVPVSVPASKTQEALLRGTAEGTYFSWDGILAFKLGLYTKYALEVPGGVGAAAFWVAINRDKFNSLSAEHKAVLTKVWGIDGSYLVAKRWNDMDQAARKAGQADGMVITTPAGADLKRWEETYAPLVTDWIKTATGKGVDGKAMYDDLIRMIADETSAGH